MRARTHTHTHARARARTHREREREREMLFYISQKISIQLYYLRFLSYMLIPIIRIICQILYFPRYAGNDKDET